MAEPGVIREARKDRARGNRQQHRHQHQHRDTEAGEANGPPPQDTAEPRQVSTAITPTASTGINSITRATPLNVGIHAGSAA